MPFDLPLLKLDFWLLLGISLLSWRVHARDRRTLCTIHNVAAAANFHFRDRLPKSRRFFARCGADANDTKAENHYPRTSVLWPGSCICGTYFPHAPKYIHIHTPSYFIAAAAPKMKLSGVSKKHREQTLLLMILLRPLFIPVPSLWHNAYFTSSLLVPFCTHARAYGTLSVRPN